MDKITVPEQLGVLYLLSTTLLSVSNYSMIEETLYLLLAVIPVDRGGSEADEEGHRPVHQEGKWEGHRAKL